MNILVTGGAGFIGSHLVKALIDGSHNVRVIDRRSGLPIDRATVEGEKYDAVFHLAAASSVQATDIDQVTDTFESTRYALRIADKTGASRFIFTSSGAVYGDGKLPISVYGACKLGSEGLVNAWRERTGKRTSILRLNNVLGPGCRGVVPDMLGALYWDKTKLRVLGDGSARKRFTHVRDVLRVLLDPPDGVHDIAPEDSTSVRQIVEWCCAAVGAKPEIQWGTDAGGWVGDMPVPYGGPMPGIPSSGETAQRYITEAGRDCTAFAEAS